MLLYSGNPCTGAAGVTETKREDGVLYKPGFYYRKDKKEKVSNNPEKSKGAGQAYF